MPILATLNTNSHAQFHLDPETVVMGGEAANIATASLDTDSNARIMLTWKNHQELSITNCGQHPFRFQNLESKFSVGPKRTIQIQFPFRFKIDDTLVELELDDEIESKCVETLESEYTAGKSQQPPSVETIYAAFEAISRIHRLIAGSQEFYETIAETLIEPGGFDGAFVLLPHNDGWKIAASRIPDPDFGITYNAKLAEQAVATRTAHYHKSELVHAHGEQESGHWCTVCPVFGRNNEPLAIVYAFRTQSKKNMRRGIRLLEAKFVKLVAEATGNSILRMQGEAEATKQRLLLDQAFSPAVVKQLESNPNFILRGEDREVSVLFADLRGFTSISEKIGARRTYELLADVMDRFCEIIYKYDGAIIDFYGDGVSAFWNAPIRQVNHAQLACSAALEIAETTPDLDKKWQKIIGRPIRVGVGVNTGMAQVGNSGSSTRLKYGPQGKTVNVASRLENATKRIGTPVLVSGMTAASIKDDFRARRICSTLLYGMAELVDVFQIIPASETIPETWQPYASALSEYENGNLSEAISILMDVHVAGEDFASEYLLEQALARKDMEFSDPHSSKSHIVAHTGLTGQHVDTVDASVGNSHSRVNIDLEENDSKSST